MELEGTCNSNIQRYLSQWIWPIAINIHTNLIQSFYKISVSYLFPELLSILVQLALTTCHHWWKIICISWPISANKQINSFCACTFRYLYIYYLPSGLFVVVSWVSFLIPPEVVPGRMALLVTLFLVLINIFNTITNVSPNVEGMTAISAWMIACMFFVFGALLAYASILYFLLVSSFDAMVPVGIWYYGTCMCLQVSDAC